MKRTDVVDIVAGSLEDLANGLETAPLPEADHAPTRQFDVEFIREVAQRIRREASA